MEFIVLYFKESTYVVKLGHQDSTVQLDVKFSKSIIFTEFQLKVGSILKPWLWTKYLK